MKKVISSKSNIPQEVRQSYLYQLLDRLRQDCDYVLSVYNREDVSKSSRELAGKYLWAGDVKSQIQKMYEIYDRLEIKPDWITREDIDEYANRFKSLKLGVYAASDVMHRDNKLKNALAYINEYLRYEFSEQYTGFDDDPEPYNDEIRLTDDLSDIGLMYTQRGRYNEVDIQVSADLINPSLKFYVNDELRDTWKYDSVDKFIDDILSNLDWDDLCDWAVDYIKNSDYNPEYSTDYVPEE